MRLAHRNQRPVTEHRDFCSGSGHPMPREACCAHEAKSLRVPELGAPAQGVLDHATPKRDHPDNRRPARGA